jgi:PAS domain S-box-containing protein
MMARPSDTATHSDSKLIMQLALIMLIMVVGMTAYESIKQWLIPDISIWGSHTLTIAFSSLAATLAAFYVLRRRQALYRQLVVEISERNSTEAELRRVQTELETRVQDRTRELETANQALRDEISEREQVEAALRKSEGLYSTLARNFPNGAVVLFDCDLRYTLAEGQGLQVIGLSKERIEGKTICEIFPPETCELLEPAYRSALSGASTTLEVGFLDRCYEVDVVPVKNEQGEISAGMAMTQDITERKRAEVALRESEKKLRSLIEQSFEGIVLADERGAVVEWNHSEEELTGLSSVQVLGKPIWDVIFRLTPSEQRVPSLYSPLKEGIEETLHTGEARWLNQLVERQIERPDGRRRTIDTITYPIRTDKGFLIGRVSRDITERVQAFQLLEQRVEERTRELSTLLEVSRNVASTLELKPLLSLILDQLADIVDYTGAAIYTIEGDELQVLDYRGPVPLEQVLRYRPPSKFSQVHQVVISTRAPLVLDDVGVDTPLAQAFREWYTEPPGAFRYIQSWLGIPMIVKDRVIGILGLSYNQANHFTAQHARLGMAIANQAAIAIENARLYGRAQRLAALEERQRLARELHDSVSQALYGIQLGALTAHELLEAEPADTDLKSNLAEPLEYVLGLADAGLAEMRALIFELRPESLETEGLVAGLTKQIASLRTRHGIAMEVSLCQEPTVALEVKETLYRIAQEAMHNIVKHAEARHVNLKLQCDGGEILMEISDDGKGFDADASYPGHLGLRSMRERAEQLGGKFEVTSASEVGTRLVVRVPI